MLESTAKLMPSALQVAATVPINISLVLEQFSFRKSSQVTVICIALFNNANCVKAALHELDIKLGGLYISFTDFRREIVCRNSVILLWPDKISSLNLGCSRVRLSKGLIWFLWSCSDGRLGDRVFTWDQSLGLI